MDQLFTYAAIAEIFSGLAIVVGGAFAAIQFMEYRRKRRDQVAVELCRRFAEPELARAITLIKRLPDGVSLADLKRMDDDYDDAAQIVGMTFEMMGLLVYRNIASFTMIQQLTGGLLLMMWRKIETWARETRVEQGNPRYAEWMEWLANRIQECEEDVEPAYTAHSDWRDYKS